MIENQGTDYKSVCLPNIYLKFFGPKMLQNFQRLQK